MSLKTDIIFVKALQSNSELIEMLPAGDIYNTAIPVPDEDLINVPATYVLVSFDGMTNQGQTKDYAFEGDSDNVTISVMMCAETRSILADIADMVRDTVRDYFENLTDDDEDYSLVPHDYQLTADGVIYDADKPCYFQRLIYQCDTNI